MRQKTLNTIRSLIGDYISSHISREHNSTDYPVCKTCGCLLPLTAIRGKKEVRQRPIPWVQYQAFEDYIYTPYYCNKCAPKPKEKSEPEKSGRRKQCQQ